MADAQKTIDLIFNGIDKTGAATLSALNNAKSFTESLQNVTQPIADFTVGALKVEAGLLAAGLAMTVFAVKVAGDFDTAFREIATLISVPIDELGAFKTAIQDYAATSTQPMKDVTQAIYNAISAGVPYADSINFVTNAEKLAVAGKADLNSATVLLAGSLNAYGLGAESATRFSDALFTTVKQGQTTLPELAASLSMVTSAAATLEIPFETLLAAVATLTSVGMPTAQAVTAINAAMTALIKPSSEATKLAAELGIEFGVQAVKSKGLEVVLADVAKATGGNVEQMAKLFGSSESLKAVLPLVGAAAEKFGIDMEAMGKKAGAVQTAFDIMSQSIENSQQKVINAFEGMLAAVGTPLLDEFGGIANAIAGIFTALGASVKGGGLKDLVDYIEGLFGELQQALDTVAKNLPAALESADFSGFKGGIDAVLGAIKNLFGAIDLTTVEGLKTAIETAGAAFFGLSKYVAGVIESFKPLLDTLVAVGKGIKDVDGDFIEFLGNLGGIASQLNLVLPLFTGLLAVLAAKSTIGLAGDIATLVKTIPTLTTSMIALTPALTAAGVAMAAYFASDQVIKLVVALTDWKNANDHLNESQAQSAEINDRATDSLERFAETSGIAVKNIDEASQLIDDGVVVWSTAANGWVEAGDALADVGFNAQTAGEDFRKSESAYTNSAEAAAVMTKAATKLAGAQKDVATYTLQTVSVYDALTGAITGYEQQLVKTEGGTVKLGDATDKAGGSLSKVSEETKKAAEAQKLWSQEVAKMAFQEKLALIDSQTKIATANIQAFSATTVSAFGSIDNSINSTAEVLGGLFSQFGNFDKMGFTEQWKIIEQINKENKWREDAFKKQGEALDAQIKMMNAQADALNRGDGMITINGDGLQPHLEAMMWEVLKAIQVKVNQDGLKMLMGA